MKTRGERIKSRRKELNLSQQALANAIGVSRVTISQWENNETEPVGSNLLPLAKALETTAAYIDRGTRPVSSHAPSNEDVKPAVQIPVIDWKDVKNWLQSEVDDAKNLAISYVPHTGLPKKPDFALSVSGNLMGDIIPNGSTVFVCTNTPPAPGHFVLASIEGRDLPVLRKLDVVEDGTRYLFPLDEKYLAHESFKLTQADEIIGVVVSVFTLFT